MFDIKIWLKKVGFSLVSVIVVGGISVWGDSSLWLAILPALEAIRNYWKHK